MPRLHVCALAVLALSGACGTGGSGATLAPSGAQAVDDADAGIETSTDVSPKAGGTDGSADSGCTPAKCAAEKGPAKLCWEWVCAVGGSCQHVQQIHGTACEDGDPCTINETCVFGGVCEPGDDLCECREGDAEPCFDVLGLVKGPNCAGAPKCVSALKSGKEVWLCELDTSNATTCPASGDTECRKNTCDPKTGSCAMVAVNEGGKCDDGIACTMNDVCKSGTCVLLNPSSNACFCTPGKVDNCWGKLNLFVSDKLCTGEPMCTAFVDEETQQIDYKCELNKATVVTCDTSKDTKCLGTFCNPYDGKCKPEPQNEGLEYCDDGDPCTLNGYCSGGKCLAGLDLCGCKNDADCAAKDDKDPCNGVLYCDLQSKSCKSTEPVDCPSSGLEPCVMDMCVSATGKCTQVAAEEVSVAGVWVQKSVGGQKDKVLTGKIYKYVGYKARWVGCDDGSPCTKDTLCDGKACQGGHNKCPCGTSAACAGKSTNKCIGPLVCNDGKCEPDPTKAPKPCVGAVAGSCLKNACEPKTGDCKQVYNSNACDDDNVCTIDACTSDKKDCTHTPAAKGQWCHLLGEGLGNCDGKGACVVL